jgi:hypothetical protein
MEARLREAVRRRAQGRCEYCQFPESCTRVPFQIDHVMPEKHGGVTAFENLAFSCFFCNTFKGPNLSGLGPQTGELTRLFHPRCDPWPEHFRWEGVVVIGLTAIGRVTIQVLRINRADAVAVRRSLQEEGMM